MSSSLLERFNDKWIPEPHSGCWLWTAAISRSGYGRILAKDRKNCHAHRIAWELYIGEIPNGMNVCHHCDVPSCVNPDHLFIGTDRDNLLDSIRKGRHPYPVGYGMNWKTIRNSAIPKPKCKHGHLLSSENLYISPAGLNACKTCRRNNVRKWRASH